MSAHRRIFCFKLEGVLILDVSLGAITEKPTIRSLGSAADAAAFVVGY